MLRHNDGHELQEKTLTFSAPEVHTRRVIQDLMIQNLNSPKAQILSRILQKCKLS